MLIIGVKAISAPAARKGQCLGPQGRGQGSRELGGRNPTSNLNLLLAYSTIFTKRVSSIISLLSHVIAIHPLVLTLEAYRHTLNAV